MYRVTALVALFLASTLAHAQDKYEVKQLLGKWEPVKAPEGLKASMEFKKEDKLEINIEFQGKQEKLEGSYKLEGENLTVTFTKNGKEISRKGKITKLTEKELIIKDEESGQEEEMKKAS